MIMRLSKKVLAAAQTHANNDFPNEACGLIVKDSNGTRQYIACRNDAKTKSEHFIINTEDYCQAEDQGEILAIVHSHPNASSKPSMADKINCEFSQLPWLILTSPDVGYEWLKPSKYVAPLLGREFAHGTLDCWALCRDFFYREWGLELPNYKRSDLWWEEGEQPSLYEQYYKEAGFYKVDKSQLQRGDMLVMQIGKAAHPNHAAIYLGDDPYFKSEETSKVIGNSLFIHHMYGRISERAIYGSDWEERTIFVLRHKEAIKHVAQS